MTCHRCHAEDVTTDTRGLCLACQQTEALPGLQGGAWEIRLTNPEGQRIEVRRLCPSQGLLF